MGEVRKAKILSIFLECLSTHIENIVGLFFAKVGVHYLSLNLSTPYDSKPIHI